MQASIELWRRWLALAASDAGPWRRPRPIRHPIISAVLGKKRHRQASGAVGYDARHVFEAFRDHSGGPVACVLRQRDPSPRRIAGE
jgi:hypothetical protein